MNELKHCNPYSLAWQSKVGPLPWLEPFTDDALKVKVSLLSRIHMNSFFNGFRLQGYVKQGQKNFILVPIAFVNEHIETLHELDIEYCDELAKEVSKEFWSEKLLADKQKKKFQQIGAEQIRRAAAPNDHPIFINALSDVVINHLKSSIKVNPKFLMRCPHCVNPRCSESKKWYTSFCA